MLLVIFSLAGAGHLYYYFTGNFRPAYILGAKQYPLSVAVPALEQKDQNKISALLRQPYYYLGHGHQTFVFLGEDGKTVLKLFMKEFVSSNWIRDIFPPVYPFRRLMLHKGRHHDFRLNRVLTGYSLCYALDKENSGLLYLHIDSDPAFDALTVVDGLGFKHRIPAADVVFALQKKAVTTKKVLHQLLSQGDVEGAKEKLMQMRALYQNQFNKGLVDRDRNFLENTGFSGERAIRIDVGKVVEHQNHYPLDNEFYRIFEIRLKKWLQSNYPQFVDVFSQDLQKKG